MPLINNLDKYFKKAFLLPDDIDIQFNTSRLNLHLEFKDAEKLAAFEKKIMSESAKKFFFSKTQNIFINNDNLPLVKGKIVNIINDMMDKNFKKFLETE
jgi:hypothetical protein